MHERRSVHPVGGPDRPKLHSTDEEIDILAYFCSHPHSSVRTTYNNELPLTVLPRVWVQQDGSPAHHTTVVKQWLNNEFPEKWIGLHGPVEFPPRSPDLTPMDFYSWGRLRTAVFLSPPLNQAELQQRTQDGCREITEQPLDRVRRSVIRRMQLCIGINGKHFGQAL
ncbi:hypothetical protein AVEN_103482-1 [Araneus ventricosus]|uniref:Tc1-like transposase DDE domain-containing protein n=1 Tax=Araneus ventricosus TaxID=182803 RepID=A0A4Y2IZQ5_ARAVE|nr:hypothetical protein AVEN_103482-1 [Araneus ventricosus]